MHTTTDIQRVSSTAVVDEGHIARELFIEL